MKQSLVFLLTCVLFFSCAPEKIDADLLVKNATIYTVDSDFSIAKAFVVKEGKILEIGIKPELELKYGVKETFDAQGKTIVPGLIDGHGHLYNLGVTLQQVNLVGTKSFKEVIERVVAFQNEKNSDYILGRGWDQNDWEVKQYPTKKELDSLFPNTPVALTRIDGHAMLANSKALAMAGILKTTKLPGGEVIVEDGMLTGILIDTPMELVQATFPKPNKGFIKQALVDAEAICLSLGLTTVNDAGLSKEVIETIDQMQQDGSLAINVYAMISNTPDNLDYFLNKGIIKTKGLNVRSVKVYADGALGSRGATLKESYSDKEHHFGAMITPQKELLALASRIKAAGYQMNTHAIGDSANIAVLRAYNEVLKNEKEGRWKVEHAQVITGNDFDYFSNNILPSIQPTHATSDMYWAEDRLGPKRIKGAYAYKTLLNKAGKVVLGTDFPVEEVNPMYTFYAATARKDLANFPKEGYRMEEALTREETLKGMTLWAAYSNFEETEKGSIEKGKNADFTVLDRDIMKIPLDSIPKTNVTATFIRGEKVYQKQ